MPLSETCTVDAESGADPGDCYRRGKEAHQAALAAAARELSRADRLRMAVPAATLAGFLAISSQGFPASGLLLLALGAAASIGCFVRHDRAGRRVARETHLRDINQAGEDRRTGAWRESGDRGEEFADPGHPFSGDLDVFGPSSLFQRICAAETRLGRVRLADFLRVPVLDGSAIVRRQGMVRALASRLEWRQEFQAAGKELSRAKEDPHSLLEWAESGSGIFFSRHRLLAIRLWGLLGPVTALFLVLALALVPGAVSPFPPFLPLLLLVAVNSAILLLHHAETRAVLSTLGRQRRNLEAYHAMLRLIETGDFEEANLAGLTAEVRPPGGRPSSRRIGELRTIADWLDIRQSPFLHAVLNLAFLWDLQWLGSFQAWKIGNGAALRKWLECIADLEALGSLSILHFENPHWCFPTVHPGGRAGGGETFQASGLGHPLLPPAERVRNDFSLGPDAGRIAILTGSNMSGKSTLLRAVGINLVLAYAGAPVCASGFGSGLYMIYTSMRLRDDLDRGISSFHAEILRIRSIAYASQTQGSVLFLIDEIFRGTNSKDRIAGASEVLIRLSRMGAVGLVSTHDLELGRLAEEHPGTFRNFHFTEYYEDGRIRFDYRLRPGLSGTRNALHLMRLVGIRDAAPEPEQAGDR